jgi:hypothetical protein
MQLVLTEDFKQRMTHRAQDLVKSLSDCIPHEKCKVHVSEKKFVENVNTHPALLLSQVLQPELIVEEIEHLQSTVKKELVELVKESKDRANSDGQVEKAEVDKALEGSHSRPKLTVLTCRPAQKGACCL